MTQKFSTSARGQGILASYDEDILSILHNYFFGELRCRHRFDFEKKVVRLIW